MYMFVFFIKLYITAAFGCTIRHGSRQLELTSAQYNRWDECLNVFCVAVPLRDSGVAMHLYRRGMENRAARQEGVIYI
jgi:hypothetical protein